MKKRAVNLTTDAHRPAFNDFADAMRLAESREGWRSSEVLRNFLEAAYLAVRGRMLVGNEFEKNEAEYMAIVKACRHPQETMMALTRMTAATMSALLSEPVDFIGPVFSELSADSGMGQFFTPYSLSYMMAKMIVGDNPRDLMQGRGHLRLMEPASGVGGMILATNVVLREAGLDVAREAHWVAVDIDRRAMCACYLQLAITDCSAEVYRGNTLAPESTWVGTLTPAAAMFPKLAPRVSIDRPDEPPVPAPPVTGNPPTQLTLF